MMDPLVRIAAASDIALNIARETGAAHGLPVPQGGLAQFGLFVGSAYLLHEACGGVAGVAQAMRRWWRKQR